MILRDITYQLRIANEIALWQGSRVDIHSLTGYLVISLVCELDCDVIVCMKSQRVAYFPCMK